MAESDWISAENWVDRPATVITASAEDLQNPARNVAQSNIDVFWRVLDLQVGATDFFLDIDFNEDMPIGAFLFLTPRANDPRLGDFHLSIGRTDTVRWQFWADGATVPGDPTIYDSTVMQADVREGYGYHCPVPVPTFNARYCRLTIDAISRAQIIAGPTVEKGFADISRVWIGDRFDPENNHTYRHREGWRTASLKSKNPREASAQVDRGAHYRAWGLTYSCIADSEYVAWKRLGRLIGNDAQFVLARSKDAGDIAEEVMLCMRTNDEDDIESIGPDFWEQPMRVEESL